MVRTKLVPKRINIRCWPPRERYTEYKIKTILPELKTINIKKNSQVVRTVTEEKHISLQTTGLKTFNSCLRQFGKITMLKQIQ